MKTIRCILAAAIIFLSLANAGYALHKYYHLPVFQHDDMWYRDATMIRARAVLKGLDNDRVQYLPGPGNSLASDIWPYFETQYLLTPTLLYRNDSQTPWVLVNFGKLKPTVPMPGLTLVEDFGNGLSLFRRNR
jgi:hypothetical protein